MGPGQVTSRRSTTALGIAVLGLLAEKDMHPYEMYQLLIRRRADRLVKVRPGSLYHTVSRLLDCQLVAVAGMDREGNRPERTVYRITDAGRASLTARIAELLGTPTPEYPSFRVALAEAHNLPASEAMTLLEGRIRQLDAEVAELDDMCSWASDHDIPRRYWVELQYTRSVVAAQAQWLRGLITEIGSGELPWDTDEHEKAHPHHSHAPRPHPQ